jgi:hypothetical protein
MEIDFPFKKTPPYPSHVDHLDRGRAEVCLNVFRLCELKSPDVARFVGAVFAASRGDPDVKTLLLDAPFPWLPGIEAEALSAKFERLWDGFQSKPPATDGLRTLREMCLRQKHPWPDDMVIALFDKPEFDWVAYLDWHNSPD